jgi:hypothetical protein
LTCSGRFFPGRHPGSQCRFEGASFRTFGAKADGQTMLRCAVALESFVHKKQQLAQIKGLSWGYMDINGPAAAALGSA